MKPLQKKSVQLKILAFFPKKRIPAYVFRIEAYLKFINNYSYEFIMKLEEESVFYSGSLYQKIFLFIKIFFRRCYQLLKGNYNIVLINREAFPVFGIFFEYIICKVLKKKLIFDFDDAIWISNVSEGNKKYGFLKSFSKFEKIMKMADVIIAGNKYLADYALQRNANTHIIPSCIDLDLYTLKEKSKKNTVCIGWCGSESTLQYLLSIKDVLINLQVKYGKSIYFKIIGSKDNVKIEGLNVLSTKWTKDTEVEQLRELDIGIMPLPNDEWAKGKCSMKGIQYMGLGISTIMSAVGMNLEVITHEENGFLANSKKEWFEYLSILIEDKVLRDKFGIAGRKVIEENYSIQAWKNKWIQLVTSYDK